MNYNALLFPKPPGYTHLQGIGDVKGKPLSQLVPGDVIMWNYGYKCDVVRVTQMGAKMWELVERSHTNGKEYTRRKHGTTIIACQENGKFWVLS